MAYLLIAILCLLWAMLLHNSYTHDCLSFFGKVTYFVLWGMAAFFGTYGLLMIFFK